MVGRQTSTLYDRIGDTYTWSRRADPGIVHALAEKLCLSPSGAYLDLACGTGNYTLALSGLGGTWSALDVSGRMLAQARARSEAIHWVLANARSLPFPSASFDGVICTLAIHHFDDLEVPCTEVRRILRSGSFVVFTGLAEQMHRYWLCHYFPRMMARSIEKMPSESRVRAALLGAGFKSVTVTPFFVTNELQDGFLYSGKHRPEIYLDPAVRANISSFANLAQPAELEDGLARLAADLRSGAFTAIKSRYTAQVGDYAYVTAQTEL